MTAGAVPCPSSDALERLLGESLADAERTAVEAHVETCRACQERLEGLLAADAPDPPVAVRPAIGPEPDEAFLTRLRRIPPRSIEDPKEAVPGNLGPYDLLERLGGGGMGTVYRARHRELDKVVALKVLPADRVDEATIARFRNEMKAAGRLAHTNIVATNDAGRVGGTHFLAMDFVDGLDLTALVERLGPLSIPDACELVRQAALGLQHVCDCGLAHRDVKPSNLMLGRDGVVKVLDLGLARSLAELPAAERLTASGVLLGTADYIAPEQIDQAHAADARADVYGLGGTLFHLLAGSPPYGDQSSWLDKLRAHAAAPVPDIRRLRPEIPAALATLLQRMLAKNPDDRPATPGVVAAALRPLAHGADPSRLFARAAIAAPRRPMAPDTTLDRPIRRSRIAIGRYALAALAGAALTLMIAAPFFGSRKQAPANSPADAPPGASASVEEPEGVRLTYGPDGPPRPDNKVYPGEAIDLAVVAHGMSVNREGEVDASLAGELIDANGKKHAELLPVPFKGPLYLGGSTFSGRVSFELSPRQLPGQYKARARLTDQISGRVVHLEHPVYVLRPAFAALRLRITHDEDGAWPTGSHLTVGQRFYVRGRAVSFVRKSGRVHVGITVMARDRDGKDTAISPLKPLDFDREVNDDFTYFDFTFGPLKTIMAGEATIVVELRDQLGETSAMYQLPVVIHPPRSIWPAVKH